MNKRVNAMLSRLKMRTIFRVQLMKKKVGGFDISSIIGLCVYIAVIPLIMTLLDDLSTSLTGTAGTLLASIIALVPLILVIKVLDKLNF